MSKQRVDIMPGDDLEFTLTREPGVPLALDNDKMEVVFHGVDSVRMSTIVCPDPTAHWFRRPSLRERVADFLRRLA